MQWKRVQHGFESTDVAAPASWRPIGQTPAKATPQATAGWGSIYDDGQKPPGTQLGRTEGTKGPAPGREWYGTVAFRQRREAKPRNGRRRAAGPTTLGGFMLNNL